ncbi:hypothetical protein V8E53_014853 [Lactarius tabidus]
MSQLRLGVTLSRDNNAKFNKKYIVSLQGTTENNKYLFDGGVVTPPRIYKKGNTNPDDQARRHSHDSCSSAYVFNDQSNQTDQVPPHHSTVIANKRRQKGVGTGRGDGGPAARAHPRGAQQRCSASLLAPSDSSQRAEKRRKFAKAKKVIASQKPVFKPGPCGTAESERVSRLRAVLNRALAQIGKSQKDGTSSVETAGHDPDPHPDGCLAASGSALAPATPQAAIHVVVLQAKDLTRLIAVQSPIGVGRYHRRKIPGCSSWKNTIS